MWVSIIGKNEGLYNLNRCSSITRSNLGNNIYLNYADEETNVISFDSKEQADHFLDTIFSKININEKIDWIN